MDNKTFIRLMLGLLLTGWCMVPGLFGFMGFMEHADSISEANRFWAAIAWVILPISITSALSIQYLTRVNLPDTVTSKTQEKDVDKNNKTS